MRTLSKSDTELLSKLPLFRNAEIDGGIGYAFLHPLLDLGLGAYQINKIADFGLLTVGVENEQIALMFDCETVLENQQVSRLLDELDSELIRLGLPISAPAAVPF